MKNFKTILLLISLVQGYGCSLNNERDIKEITKELYGFIKAEKEIKRVYENQKSVDFNAYEIEKEAMEFKDLEYNKLEENSFIQLVGEGLTVISKDSTKYLDNNLIEDNAYFVLSFPFYNKDKTKALMEITYRCGRYCSYKETCLYMLGSTGWALEKKLSQQTW